MSWVQLNRWWLVALAVLVPASIIAALVARIMAVVTSIIAPVITLMLVCDPAILFCPVACHALGAVAALLVDTAVGLLLALALIVAVVGLAVNLVSMKLLSAGSSESLNVKGAYFEVLFRDATVLWVENDELVIESWAPGRGLTLARRK